MTIATASGPPTELAGVERGLQRASGIGISAFAAQALAVAVLGRSLYPAWWYLVPGPLMAAAVAGTVVACLRGRSRRSGRLAAVAVLTAGAVATAVATADTVAAVGSVVSPLVTAFAILLGLFDPPAIALSAGGVLIAGQLVGVGTTRPLPLATVLAVAAIQVAVLLAGAAARRILRRSATRLDAARARLARSVAADRAAAETRRDRREQERRLHDTVLSTLTALARSSLAGSDQLRARCAADARYLRSLRRGTDDVRTGPAGLLDALRALARDRTAPGFRVHLSVAPGAGDVPLPDHVADAMARAAGEGVANASRHSGADAVEIAVRAGDGGGDGRITVEVVDRGGGTAGSSVPTTAGGLGVRRSIVERMADAGGHGYVEHEPGTGTRVVLRWPA